MSPKGNQSKRFLLTAFILLCVLAFFFYTTADEPAADTPYFAEQPARADRDFTLAGGQMAVHFIDVAQGDAILIQTAGQFILIDGGPTAQGQTVVDYLNKLGVSRLNLVIATHPHEDHIGGLIRVLESLPVDEIIDPAVPHTTKLYEKYLTLIDDKNIRFTEGRAGMTRDLGGGAAMQIVHPVSPSPSHLNNASVVVRVTLGQVAFLLTGDAEAAAERGMLAGGYNLSAAVLKVAHHGSRHSTIPEFLAAVNPAIAVISWGPNNYGHPHEETLEKLAAAGCKIYGTNVHGSILIVTDGAAVSVYRMP